MLMLSAVATGWNQNLVSARVISVGHLTCQSLTSSSFYWTRVLITGRSLKSARATIDVFVQDRLGNPAESFYQDIYWAMMKAEVTAFTNGESPSINEALASRRDRTKVSKAMNLLPQLFCHIQKHRQMFFAKL